MTVKTKTLIVTAFFDIGRSDWKTNPYTGDRLPGYLPRDEKFYFDSFARLSEMGNDFFVVVGTQAHADLVKRVAHDPDRVHVEIIDLTNQEPNAYATLERVLANPHFRGSVANPNMPERWSAKYLDVNWSKFKFLELAKARNKYEEFTHYAWLDFGYARPGNLLPTRVEGYPENKITLFSVRELDFERPFYQLALDDTVYIQGSFFVCAEDLVYALAKKMTSIVESMIVVGMIDDEQTGLAELARYNIGLYGAENCRINLIKVSEATWFDSINKISN